MIKTNELRIGNWVMDENGIIQYVYQIYQGCVELSADETGQDDMDYHEKEIFGIPVTEEILVSAGFDMITSAWWEKDGYFKLLFLYLVEEGMSFNYCSGDEVVLSRSYRYVHQLQNIYFSVTGYELDISFKEK